MSETFQRAQAPRILVVAESSFAAQAIVDRLGEFHGALHISVAPGRAAADATETGAEVVLLVFASLAAAERQARALRDTAAGSGAPIVVALCGAGELAAASRLVRDGGIDDYLLHPGDGADPERLATSVRIASRLARAAASRAAPPARPHPVVFLVEDDEFSHQLVAITLESRDVGLVYEGDGAAAFERIREVRPDLILMDVMLPGRDGVELTQHLKADPELSAIPVVMLTGEARREILARSIEAGAADFIVKPFTPDALIAKLLRFLPTLR